MPAAQTIPDLPIHLLPRDSSVPVLPPFRRLEGKVAIVTGGAGGIGEATVRLFVLHGAKVVIADINDAAGAALANSLAPFATYVRCDVGLESDVAGLVDATLAQHGKLDILFNNAGVLGSQTKAKKSILNFDPDEFDRVVRVNVKGTALCIKHAARAMVGARRAGCIVSTASVAGVMGGLGPHSYTASKHAIVGLTKNAACELGAYGIRVNCISPFGVATPMLVNAWRSSGMDGNGDGMEEVTAEKMEEFVREMATLKGATLRANDIAEAALYLASDESKKEFGREALPGSILTDEVKETKIVVNIDTPGRVAKMCNLINHSINQTGHMKEGNFFQSR